MTETGSDHIVKELKVVFDKMTAYSERAQSDLFLSFYENSPAFLHISADGQMRNYEEFKNICSGYYNSLKEQKITTTREKFNVIGKDLVVLDWTGNIVARFRNEDIMNMNNYSITSIFKKIGNNWKVIHSHESSLPPEIIKK